MKRLFVTTCSILALVVASVSFATVSAHVHTLGNPAGKTIHIGPSACGADPDSGIHRGFTNFHWNVHKGEPGEATKSLPVTIGATGC
jgi:hypothetical protein